MMGVIIIALVCCVVGTSALWVIIIYQTRKGFSNSASKHVINQQILADNKSENSASSKDSGTGNSTKKSTEDLQLEG